jgi:hypothetical protein
MKWLDSRLEKPTSNHFDSYFVVAHSSGLVMLGFADWMPKDGYTDGDWQNVRCTNGNGLGGEVLYWMEHPSRPEILL